jgi:hypothetical protein
MFEFTVIAVLSLLGIDAPVHDGVAMAEIAAGSCTNTRGGSCSLSRWKNGRASLKTSRAVGTLRIVPPAASGQQPFSLTFGGFVKDCSAETTCSNGATVSCSATGTNTQCTSNATSVGCLTANDQGEGTSGSSGTCPAG